jgi:hypothetical protein
MGSYLIVFVHPDVEVGLQLADCCIDLFAEGDAIELIEHCLVKALDDSVGLRALCLGACVIDVVFVAVMGTAIFGAAIGQDPLEWDAGIFVERNDPIVEEVSGGDRGFSVVEFGKAELGVDSDSIRPGIPT